MYTSATLLLGVAFGWFFWAIVAFVKNFISNYRATKKGIGEVNDGPPKITISLLTFSYGATALCAIAWILLACAS